MNYDHHVPVYRSNTLSVLAGIVIGGLVGAATALLLAPQSGEYTRAQIMEKGVELRDRANEIVGDTMAQVRMNANKLQVGGLEKLNELKHQGQDIAAEQLDRVSEVAKAGKKAIQNA